MKERFTDIISDEKGSIGSLLAVGAVGFIAYTIYHQIRRGNEIERSEKEVNEANIREAKISTPDVIDAEMIKDARKEI